MTPADLVAERLKLEDWADAESKRFMEHLKPVRTRVEEINNLLLAFLNDNKFDSIKTEHGTAYKSTIVTPKVADRDAYLDFVNDNWDTVGNDMLQVSAPKKEALKDWSEANEGRLPPGVTTSAITRINVRRS